jgi:hypothetical protein
MEIDFITALGRLLRDGSLRDAFAVDSGTVAAQMHLRRTDLSAFLQLIPDELEFQARILLRKRFELTRTLLPETTRRLGDQGWPLFFEYGRANWPAEPRAGLQDAFQFCQRLDQLTPETVRKSERNRLQFALSEKHLAIHWHLLETVRGKARPMMQLFYRGRSPMWRELVFAFGL